MSTEDVADGLHALVAADAELELLAEGFEFVEGPVWDPAAGHLLFTDIPGDTIYRWDPVGGLAVWRRPSGMANGLTLDPQLRLLACEAATSLVTRTEPDGTVTTRASHYGGREINSPNDIVTASDGSTYFTDPPSGRSSPHGRPRPRELDFQGVYRIPPEGGELELVVEDMLTPNGLCFSPDERRLYVNDSLRMHIRAFEVGDDGSLRGGDVFFVQEGITPDPAEVVQSLITTGELPYGTPDGMKCDERGNVWCTGDGGIWVIAPDGTFLGLVETPQIPANLAWGGAEGTTLFICATHAVYRVQTKVRGIRPGWVRRSQVTS